MTRIAPTPPTNRRLASPEMMAATLAKPIRATPPVRRPDGTRALGGAGQALTAAAIVIRVVRIEAATNVATVINAPAAIDATIASTDTENTIAAFFSWISGPHVPAEATMSQAAAIPGRAPRAAA